jgi:hypothetical protein
MAIKYLYDVTYLFSSIEGVVIAWGKKEKAGVTTDIKCILCSKTIKTFGGKINMEDHMNERHAEVVAILTLMGIPKIYFWDDNSNKSAYPPESRIAIEMGEK